MELLFDGFIAIVLMIFFIASYQIDGITISSDKIGASGFPQAIIIISFMILIFISYKNIKNIKSGKQENKFNFQDKGFKIMVLSMGLLAAYIFTLNIIGFILGTFIFSVSAAKIMGYNENLKTLIFSLGLTVGVTLIFGKLFFVGLPRGIGLLREISYLIY